MIHLIKNIKCIQWNFRVEIKHTVLLAQNLKIICRKLKPIVVKIFGQI